MSVSTVVCELFRGRNCTSTCFQCLEQPSKHRQCSKYASVVSQLIHLLMGQLEEKEGGQEKRERNGDQDRYLKSQKYT